MEPKLNLEKIIVHRKKYFPVLEKYLNLHKKLNKPTFPLDIAQPEEMAIILELIDLEYLDKEAFLVKKRGDDIMGIKYFGSRPLTQKGYQALMRNAMDNKKRIRQRFLFAVLLLLAIAVWLLC